jgi:hypothetical protein
MNSLEKKIASKAELYARELLANARQNESVITADLQRIASAVSAEMVGLEHKFKTEESLIRKIAETSVKDTRKLLELEYFLDETIEEIIKIRAE